MELMYSGMPVKELAALSGVNKHSIDNYLNKRGQMPSVAAAVKIARALGVSVEYLVTGNEIKERTAATGVYARSIFKILDDLDNGDKETLLGIAKLIKQAAQKRKCSPSS
ncbi:MAG: helix-turn-helix domain-containing protein [Spirochaetaceae bacterium]|nr:helix-turn-helix domain-containing protein [Spirochaetaceae bacterium]